MTDRTLVMWDSEAPPHNSCKHCGGMATRMEVLDSRQEELQLAPLPQLRKTELTEE